MKILNTVIPLFTVYLLAAEMGDSVIDNRSPRSLSDGEDSTEEQMQFHPPELWGLDYQFNVYNKMYIRDILQMNQYSMFPGTVNVLNF